MQCPKCSYESPFTNTDVFSRDNPCMACGYDMDGVEFYGEASSEYAVVIMKEE